MKALSLNFWPTCSNQCLFCFCREQDVLAEKLYPTCVSSPKEIGKALLQNKSQCNWLILSGNEPTLNPELLVTIMLAKKLGYQVDLRTNGRLLKNKKFCRQVLQAGVDRISITLLSAEAKAHDFLSHAQGAFAETVAGLKNLLIFWEPTKIGVFLVVTNYNLKQLSKTVVFCHELGVRDLQFNFVYHRDKQLTPKLSVLAKPLQRAIGKGLKLGLKMRVYGFPLCFLGKYYSLASEFSATDEIILGSRVIEAKKTRIDFGKCKSVYCTTCKWDQICEGTWKAYFQIYGEREFEKMKIK